MRRHWSYLKYVVRHKWYVFLACLKLGVPIWIAIWHDWDKFLPDEWFPYARTFYKSDGEKQYQPDESFDRAWNAHQKRNKHHWQYWLLVYDKNPWPKINVQSYDGGMSNLESAVKELERLLNTAPVVLPIPDVYRREMLADWIGAGRALGKPKTWEWYAANRDNMKLHSDTRAWIEEQVSRLEQEYSELERLKGIGVL